MKKYRLLKDLPTFKAGDVFVAVEEGNLVHENDNVVAYSWHTLDKFPNILTDWFEEINESNRWKPERGQKYYCIDADGQITDVAWYDDGFDQVRFEIGNCFQTKEEAERVVEYLKALAVVRGDATTKFVEDESNYYVYYNVESNSLCIGCSWSCIKNGVFGLPYFATQEDAQRSIKEHKNEWLTIFGVEEGL